MIPEPPDIQYEASVERLIGRFKPEETEGFVKIASKYTSKSDIYMQAEAYEAFEQMYEAAKAAGFTLSIISATRNFWYQKGIWERKWTGVTKVGGQNLTVSHPDPEKRALKILNYSSMPGTSRHHWGTDIDLNNLTNSYFESGNGAKLYAWLVDNAPKYGFCQPYTPKGDARPHGYNEEKWHWSFFPIAQEYLRQYSDSVTYAHILGFKGSEVAEGIDVIEKYVRGIAEDCK